MTNESKKPLSAKQGVVLKNLVDTAQNTANEANTAAGNAQNTANEAKNSASSAQNTANEAMTAAGNAQNTANEAKNSAASANETANSALDKANGFTEELKKYATKENGDFTGSFSHNRLADSEVGSESVAMGNDATASGENAVALGARCTASGRYSVAIGRNAVASGLDSVSIGNANTASGDRSFAEGNETKATGMCSHSEGNLTEANGGNSHAEGNRTKANGDNSHAEGYITEALANQHVEGHFNNTETAEAGAVWGTQGTAFVIGNGSESGGASNACRITYAGEVIGKAAYSTTGADYAEYFEWADGNAEYEDRVGHFVTFDDGKFIRKANANDYVLGIVSGNPSVLGNHDECWMGRNEMDEFGRFIYLIETVTDEDGNTHEYQTYKINPDFDTSRNYIPRSERPEWDAVGMLGMLAVRDDGTCMVNGYCKVADGGIATAADTGYRVVERISENIVKIIFR